MQGKPKRVVHHLSNRLGCAVTDMNPENIVEALPAMEMETQFYVIGSNAIYMVSLGQTGFQTVCVKIGFTQKFLVSTCWGLLSMLKQVLWDSFSPKYRSSPYINLDLDIVPELLPSADRVDPEEIENADIVIKNDIPPVTHSDGYEKKMFLQKYDLHCLCRLPYSKMIL